MADQKTTGSVKTNRTTFEILEALKDRTDATLTELADVLKQCLALGRREFVGVTLGVSVGPAVVTREVTGLCELPDQHERPTVRVDPAHRYSTMTAPFMPTPACGVQL
jgi:hypothetical protein